ncbi:hypothetical protein CUS_4460 [Ruminococcus albus 8]|uniref:Uncharacterized protein n=1 Tax=Ruminococcus albus 8 TaxID=246199 RepID=E9SB51_RUMAL|nr:hypothetical protein CUS_4460 [Ruminococcus albus 8]
MGFVTGFCLNFKADCYSKVYHDFALLSIFSRLDKYICAMI